MNICIIKRNEDSESIKYLYEEFKKKNFSKVFLTDLAKLDVRISPKKIGVRCRGDFDWDIFLMRRGVEDFPFSYLVASVLEEKGIVLPSSKAILNCADRGLLARAIFKSGVLQPITYISSSAESAEKSAIKFKKFAIKFVQHGGKGVAILEKPSAASELLDVFSNLSQPFCVQRFIDGDIIKALVVGDEVIAMKERPKAGEEKSNEGKREYMRLNEEVKCDILKFAKYLNAFLFEVDLIKNNNKYFVIDVSLNPNLTMYAEISGKNIGAIFADYILKNYSKELPTPAV
jgi:glutathione synthase/RimK-type ligase-like ATP-grasp enzyme